MELDQKSVGSVVHKLCLDYGYLDTVFYELYVDQDTVELWNMIGVYGSR